MAVDLAETMAEPTPDERAGGERRMGALKMSEAEVGAEQVKLDRLRELRTEVVDLQEILASVRRGEITVQAYADYIAKTMQDMKGLIGQIQDGDAIRHLHNIWEQISICPLLARPQETLSAQEQLHYLDALERQFRRLIFIVGYLTIPARLNHWLANARPGYYVPFHAVFEDEVPDPEDRLRILNYLKWSPQVIRGGLVDAENGLIYRYDRNPWARAGTMALLLAGVAATIGIVIGLCYLPVGNWPLAPANVGTLLIGWAAVAVGLLVHVAVGTAKRAQAPGARPPILALGDLPLLLNARSGQILLKLLLTLVGLFGLAFGAGVANLTPLNAFLVGYSLDSVVELFGASLEQKAATQVAGLKKQLGLSEGS